MYVYYVYVYVCVCIMCMCVLCVCVCVCCIADVYCFTSRERGGGVRIYREVEGAEYRGGGVVLEGAEYLEMWRALNKRTWFPSVNLRMFAYTFRILKYLFRSFK